MASDLRRKTTRGLFWSSVDRFSNQGIQFVFSIILARILAPSDYGIVAMIVVFTAIAGTFVDGGFTNALVRKPELSELDKSTAFYFNIVVGFVCYALLFFTSPFIASFYKTPILSPIVKVTGLNVIFGSFCVVQRALLTKDVNFKTQAKITMACTVISGLIGLFMAYSGYGVWALVVQSTASNIFNCIFLWFCSRWRPILAFSKDSFKYLFGFGSKLMLSSLINTVYDNIYPMVIGKFYNSAQLGMFSRAQNFAQLPSTTFTGIMQRVTFPVLSLIQSDDQRLENDYRRLLRLSGFVVFPMMMLLAAVASPLIRIIITSKWDGCVLYLQILCFALMWYPIHAINLNLLQVKGRSGLFLKLEIIKKIIGVVVICVSIPFGVTAMCWGLVFLYLISLFINTYYTGKLINVGYLSQMKDLLPIFVSSVLMGAMAYSVTLLFENEWFQLLLALFVGVFSYLIVAYFFMRKELFEIINIVKR
jgi:teichuronic acid exporter